MWGNFKSWFTALSLIGKTIVVTGVSVATLGTAGAVSNSNPQQPSPQQPKVQSLKIEHHSATTTEVIPSTEQDVNDPNLASGTTSVQMDGVDGVKTKTWDVTLTNGVETNRTLVKDEVTTAPVNKIVLHGTYVVPVPSCSNGSYTNVDGVQVCSPSAVNTGGASAICSDGTYSYSLHRSGTCSHHGGVAQWL